MRAAGDARVARRRTGVVVFLALGALETLGPPRPARAQTISLISRADPARLSDTAGGPSYAGAMSADGRWTAFLSPGVNLVPGQSGPANIQNLFLYDRLTGGRILVSHASGSPTTGADGPTFQVAIDADGSVVAFVSNAANLVAGQHGPIVPNLFVYDRVAGTTLLVSHAAGAPTVTATGQSFDPSLSADGRFLAFDSYAPNLVAGITQGHPGNIPDVYLFDRQTMGTTLVSHASGSASTTGNSRSFVPAISADGGSIAFLSQAGDLVSGMPAPVGTQVFVFDRGSGATTLVSHASGSAAVGTDGACGSPHVSANGSVIAYTSAGSNLVAGQVNSGSQWNAFSWSRAGGVNQLVSHASGSPATAADDTSYELAMSADGAWISFSSQAGNLSPGESNQPFRVQIFLWSRASGQVVLVSHASSSPSTGAGGQAQSPLISADGAVAGFITYAPDVVAGQTQPSLSQNLFVYDRSTGANTLVSHVSGSAVASDPQQSGTLTPVLMSADGHYVAYASSATQLAAGVLDLNGQADVFLYDRLANINSVVSLHAPGSPSLTAAGYTGAGSTSADGRFVSYASTALNLVPGQIETTVPGYISNVFLYDRLAGGSTLVSHALGAPSTSADESGQPLVSSNGRWVAFSSAATNLVANQTYTGTTSRYQLFLFDRMSGAITLVSHAAGAPAAGGDGDCWSAAISRDGRYLTFRSTSTNLVGAASPNGHDNVYLFDRDSGVTTLVSHAAGSPSTPGNGDADEATASADGRYLAFASSATNLIAGQSDANNGADVFLFDRVSGTTVLVSHSSAAAATAGNGQSLNPVLSADGGTLAFTTLATDLIPGQAGGGAGIYNVVVFDRGAGTLALASHVPGSGTTAGNGISYAPATSADGRFIAFGSAATNLVGGEVVRDGGFPGEIFLFDRQSGTITLVSHQAGSPLSTGDSGAQSSPAISADGRWIAYGSRATDLVTGQSGGGYSTPQLFLYDRLAGTNALVSHIPASPTAGGNAVSFTPLLSADGASVVFASAASDLVAGDYNQAYDLFLYSNTLPGRDFYSLAPCRLLDTRESGQGPALSSGVERVIQLAGQCGIPPGARAVAVNVTATQPGGAGFLMLYPGDLGPQDPAASDLPSAVNFAPGQTRANNSAMALALDGSGSLAVTPYVSGGGTVQLMLDVAGYFQ
jgi:Tol biopolymer transport system component